ncbi:MAG TPA: hypothetical protein VHV10_09075 [Ktedonobacteraceae bacterium]|nr:hypothetical protein [Ktedonobacteraceae bacterium]
MEVTIKTFFTGKNNKPLIRRAATLLILGLIAANSLCATSSSSAQPNSNASAFENGFKGLCNAYYYPSEKHTSKQTNDSKNKNCQAQSAAFSKFLSTIYTGSAWPATSLSTLASKSLLKDSHGHISTQDQLQTAITKYGNKNLTTLIADDSAFLNTLWTNYNASGTFCVSPPPEDTKLVSDTSTAKVYAPSNVVHVINAGKVVIQTIETDNAALTNIFGLKPKGLPFTIYMESGAGGAYHCHCPDTTLLVSSPYNAQTSAAYAVAEMEEVYGHAMNNGWNCDFTNGEALSRALAVYQHPQLRSLLTGTEIDWWSNGAHDYISTNNAPDNNLEADGCGTLFLDYLHYRLKYDWKTIIRAGGNTLAETYGKLTNNDPSTAFRKFTEALQPFVYEGQLVLPEHSNPWDSEAEKKQIAQKKQLVWKQKIIEGTERGVAGLVLLAIVAYYIWRRRRQKRVDRDANQQMPIALENLE